MRLDYHAETNDAFESVVIQQILTVSVIILEKQILVFILMQFIAKFPLRIEAKGFVTPRSKYSGLNPSVTCTVTESEVSVADRKSVV